MTRDNPAIEQLPYLDADAPGRHIDATRQQLHDFLFASCAASKPGRKPETPQSVEADCKDDSTHDREQVTRRASSQSRSSDWLDLLKTATQSLWRDHPVRMATATLVPIAEASVRRKPLATLAIAATVGAALMLMKPWRAVSLLTLGRGIARTSNFPLIAAAVAAAIAEHHKTKE